MPMMEILIITDRDCVRPPLCSPPASRCLECSCLFNQNNCQNIFPRHCSDVEVSLGLNCGSAEGPIEYVVAALNETVMENESRNITQCLLRRVCKCLSRNTEHKMIENVEESCQELCTMPPNIRASLMTKMMPHMSLNGDREVCDPVHSQYCRRHRRMGRPTECARVCVQEGSCVSKYCCFSPKISFCHLTRVPWLGVAYGYMGIP